MADHAIDQRDLEGLVSMTDLDISSMSDEAVKQQLMDLRGVFVEKLENIHMFKSLNKMTNEQIARLGREEAAQMLFDLRDIARKRA